MALRASWRWIVRDYPARVDSQDRSDVSTTGELAKEDMHGQVHSRDDRMAIELFLAGVRGGKACLQQLTGRLADGK
jgi:hypothetical protein